MKPISIISIIQSHVNSEHGRKKKTRKNHLSPHLETNYDHEKPGKSHEIPHLSSLPRRRTSIRPGSHFGAGSDLSLKSEWAKGRLSVAARPGGIPNGHRNSGCQGKPTGNDRFAPKKYGTYRNYGGQESVDWLLGSVIKNQWIGTYRNNNG